MATKGWHKVIMVMNQHQGTPDEPTGAPSPPANVIRSRCHNIHAVTCNWAFVPDFIDLLINIFFLMKKLTRFTHKHLRESSWPGLFDNIAESLLCLMLPYVFVPEILLLLSQFVCVPPPPFLPGFGELQAFFVSDPLIINKVVSRYIQTISDIYRKYNCFFSF